MNGLLKFITCGSVDDGKSTLIGHILYDAKLLYTDQEEALELDSRVGSRAGEIDYSLLLDGLMAEREQGITIDVAYRYFTTERRSFIVADTPGHEEYTRNMAVGAAFAELAVILIDAAAGVLVQTKRHARICALMGIRHFIFAVNKMDLVDYREERFREIAAQIAALRAELALANVKIIPVSATAGDNVTAPSARLPWYEGETILAYLEQVDVGEGSAEPGFYLPVQRVCRPNHTFRGFQGEIEAGTVQTGDQLLVLPSRQKARVKALLVGDREADKAGQGQPVTVQLDKEVDVSRGSVLTAGSDLGTSRELEATLLWMDDETLSAGRDFLVKLGTKLVPGLVTAIAYQIDVNSGAHQPAPVLAKNELAVCRLRLAEDIVVAEFGRHKTLGELILIDRVTNMTAACGVVTAVQPAGAQPEPVFEQGELSARGDLFEEFYYNVDSLAITKYRPRLAKYSVGDMIPLRGETYAYPADLDILALRDKVVVLIREQRVAAIMPLALYEYTGHPLINGRGFALQVSTPGDLERLLQAYAHQTEAGRAEFYNTWFRFETYRSIQFHNDFWQKQ